MTIRLPLKIVYALSAIFINVSNQQNLDGEEVSITSLAGYKNGRPCLQNCLNDGAPYNLGLFPGPQRAVACSRNSCLCRPDFQPAISTAIKNCVSHECANELDLSSAIAIFSGYCNAYYATAPPYPTLSSPASAEVTATTAVQTLEAPITVTQTIRPDSTTIVYYSTPSSSSSHKTESLSTSSKSSQSSSPTTAAAPTQTQLILAKDSGEGRSQSDKIALGVGLSFGLLATGIGVLGLVISWKQHKGIFRYRGGLSLNANISEPNTISEVRF